MAEFLNTTGVSSKLEILMKSTDDKLILISPYLKFTERIKEHLHYLDLRKKDIRVIFRENNLNLDDNNWLESRIGIRTNICPNLHAKCYLNESSAIITSMNLYEFSQLNNNEMGIYITKSGDPELYFSVYEEATRLLMISQEIKLSVKKVVPKPAELQPKPVTKPKTGYCIRTGVSIPFNLDKPLSYESFKKWNEFGDEDYPEKYCHYSGELSNGNTSVARPVLKKYWKEANQK